MSDSFEETGIVVVSELLVSRFRKELVLEPRSTVIKIAKTSEPGKQVKGGEVDYPGCEEHFDDKQATVLLSGMQKQVPF